MMVQHDAQTTRNEPTCPYAVRQGPEGICNYRAFHVPPAVIGDFLWALVTVPILLVISVLLSEEPLRQSRRPCPVTVHSLCPSPVGAERRATSPAASPDTDLPTSRKSAASVSMHSFVARELLR